MIIESLDIKHFGRLFDFKASFDRAFNLIEGPAESGKSTLAAFITYMLYGFPATEEGETLSERMRRMPWEGASAAGSMIFSAAGARYRVERESELSERGYRDTYTLQNLDTGLFEPGELSPGERFLGVTVESFLDTAHMSGARRGGVDAQKTENAIERILFTGSERLSSENAIRMLKEAASLLSSADGKSGDLAVLEKECDQKKEQLAEATACERRHYEREEELFLTRKKIDEARAEVDKFSKLETNYYNALMIEDYDRLHALEDASEGRVLAIRAHEDAYRADKFLPDRAYISALLDAKTEALAAKREAEDAKAAYEALPEGRAVATEAELSLLSRVTEAGGEEILLARANETRQKKRGFFLLTALTGLLFAAMTVAFAFALALDGPATLLGVLGLLPLGASVVFFAEGWRKKKALLTLYRDFSGTGREEFVLNLQKAGEVRRRVSHATAEKERANVRLTRAEERLTLTYRILSDTLARWHILLDTEGLEGQVTAAIARAEEYLTENERLTAEHRAAEEEVFALRKKLGGENEVAVRARVAPDDRKRYRNQNAKDLRRGVELYTARLQQLREAERQLEDDLAAEESHDSPAAIAERILALEGRIALIRERADVITEACAALENGEERLRREILPRLSLDGCRFLYEMTDGKYSDVAVGERYALTFDEGDGKRDVAYLSHSTEDLAYYALRFALLDLMYREKPPVCVDGCTARQDDERTVSFLRALRTLTEEGKQCFFFASGKRERDAIGSVFSSYRHIKMA